MLAYLPPWLTREELEAATFEDRTTFNSDMTSEF